MVAYSRRSLFGLAFFVVFFIFLFGLFLGYQLDSYRVTETSQLLDSLEREANSFLVEEEFLDTIVGGASCDLFEKRLSSLGERLYPLGKALVAYDEKKVFEREQYDALRQQYFALELKTYILLRQSFDQCGRQGHVVLYFYDTKDNDESLRQGYSLNGLVARLGNVTVLSIDRGFEDPLLDTVRAYYNITRGPTIILDFENKNEGFVSYPELLTLLGEEELL